MENLHDIFDTLIHLTCETDLSEKEILRGVKKLFPAFDENDTYNDKYLSDYKIEIYAYNRSLGMSITESANSAEISGTLINQMIRGKRISLKWLVLLAKAEIFSCAERKMVQLKRLDAAAENGDHKAVATFLEKVYPNDYNDKRRFNDIIKDISDKVTLEVVQVSGKPIQELTEETDEE